MVKQGDDEYVTAEEACTILNNITRRTLERHVDEGRIVKYKKGLRNVVFKRTDVDRLKEELFGIRPSDE